MGGGAPTVMAPGPSAEELALRVEQTELLQLQRQMIEAQMASQQVWLPFMAQQMGIEVKIDPETGAITSIENVDPDRIKLQELQMDLQLGLAQRSLDALEGKLPVDPNLEDSLEKGERQLTSSLARKIGPGWETSTPGIEAMENFRKSAEGLRYSARTGQLTLSEQLGIARQQANQGSQAFTQGQITQGAFGIPSSVGQQFGQNAAGYVPIGQAYQADREMELKAMIANMQSQSQQQAGFGQLMGSLAGGLFGLFGASDARWKDIIRQVGVHRLGIPIYEYVKFGLREIGLLAQDVERVRPEAVVWLPGGYRAVDYGALTYG